MRMRVIPKQVLFFLINTILHLSISPEGEMGLSIKKNKNRAEFEYKEKRSLSINYNIL